MKFYEGGLCYRDYADMSYPEILNLKERTEKIAEYLNNQIKRGSNGKL